MAKRLMVQLESVLNRTKIPSKFMHYRHNATKVFNLKIVIKKIMKLEHFIFKQ